MSHDLQALTTQELRFVIRKSEATVPEDSTQSETNQRQGRFKQTAVAKVPELKIAEQRYTKS